MLFLLEMTRKEVGYSEMRKVVIRAKTEQVARRLANEEAWDEGKIWNDPQQTSCTILKHWGKQMIFCRQVTSDEW